MTDAIRDPFAWRDRLRERFALTCPAVRVPLEEAAGAVLAAPVRAPEDMPAVPIAAMDGFAVRCADLTAGAVTLPVVAELPARAGAVPAHRPGTAVRIMTGAPVPAGADAVVEVERTDASPVGPPPATVTLDLPAPPVPGRHVRGVGEEVARGSELARAGDVAGAGLLGLAAALGLRELAVHRAPRVAVIVTGDELLRPGDPHGADDSHDVDGPHSAGDSHGTGGPAPTAPGGVRESNGLMLEAALRADGVRTRRLHSGDDPAELREVLAAAAEHADLVLTTGGIGHGAFDVVKLALGAHGAGTSEFVHLALRPGGPQGAGVLPDGTPVVHLPGTPVGALVGHHFFVRPLLPGAPEALRRVRLADGPAPRSLRGRPGTLHALPAVLGRDEEGRETARALPGRRLAPFGRADAILLLAAAADAGDEAPAPSSPRDALVLAL